MTEDVDVKVVTQGEAEPAVVTPVEDGAGHGYDTIAMIKPAIITGTITRITVN